MVRGRGGGGGLNAFSMTCGVFSRVSPHPLERAIAERLNFAFETTLGGRTITALLDAALSAGVEVRVWYVGLSSVDLHIARARPGSRKAPRHSRTRDSRPVRPQPSQPDSPPAEADRTSRLRQQCRNQSGRRRDSRAEATPPHGLEQNSELVRSRSYSGLGEANPGGRHQVPAVSTRRAPLESQGPA